MNKHHNSNLQEQQSRQSLQDIQDKKKYPRFIKHNLKFSKTNKIIINLSHCHYPILSTVAKALNWKIQENETSTKWDVFWTDRAVEAEQIFRMLCHQKINHFPGMYVLSRKNCLGKSLMKLKKKFSDQYNFFPLTWMIPSQFNEFSIYFETSKAQGKNETYIAKPEASSQGKGIFLTRKLESIEGQTCVVQKYISKPYLLNGLKFDFRIYVLLAGCDPLRIYIYKQGLVRFATKLYIEPQKKNLGQTFMHLTNYSINKDNPSFIFNKSNINSNIGHKRSLTSTYSQLQKRGIDIDALKNKINQIVVKTIITGQPLLSHLYQLSQPQNYSNDICFQILGFDIILEQDGEPKLLEVNHTPSFVCDTPLDQSIKKNLIKDSLILMNISKSQKKQKISQIQQKQQLRFKNKKLKLTPEEKYRLKLQEQSKRDLYENNNLGNFQKIYPLDNNEQLMKKYKQFLDYSTTLFKQKNGFKKKNATIASDQYHPKKIQKTIPSKTQQLETQKKLPIILKTLNCETSLSKRSNHLASINKKEINQQLSSEKSKNNIIKSIILQKTSASQALNNIQLISQKKVKNLSLFTLNTKQKISQNRVKQSSLQQKSQKEQKSFRKPGNFIRPKLLQMEKESTISIKYVQSKKTKNTTNYEKFIYGRSDIKNQITKKILKVLQHPY